MIIAQDEISIMQFPLYFTALSMVVLKDMEDVNDCRL
jgi:hypothetical protein